MLPKFHLLQLIPSRARKALERADKLVWEAIERPVRIHASASLKERGTLAQTQSIALEEVDSFPQFWGPKFSFRWYKLELPRLGKDSYLSWHDQGEATVYLDGTPWYGFDPGHKHCPIPTGTRELWIQSTCCRTGVWVNDEEQEIGDRGSCLEGASLWKRNHAAWELRHDLAALIEWMDLQFQSDMGIPDFGKMYGYQPALFSIDPALRRLLRDLSDAIDAFDQSGLKAIRPLLKKVYKRMQAEPQQIKAVLTGHAHIDLVWLWPEATGQFKATHTFATMLRLMQQYPEFRFGYSQPASYEAIKAHSPKQFAEVQQQIKAGRWEATGALYVESDTQLACGEALVRAFELGQKGFRKLRGSDSRAVWLPDVFGYSGCLPQIMQGFGVDYFFTQKLTWSTINRFPYSSFVWRGHDGSEVLAHVMQAVGYNATGELSQLRECAQTHQQADIHPEFLLPTGYGDGGGGATEEMLERARRAQSLYRIPKAEWGSIESFFDRLAPKKENLPAWRGEMYLEYHRGVQTTHCDLKKAFRRTERSLQALEAVHCASKAGPIAENDWKRLVFAQFHDYIPGSSIMEVYEEGIPELNAISQRSETRATEKLESKSGSAALFNPLPIAVTHMAGSKELRLPPLAGTSIKTLSKNARSLPKAKAKGRQLETDRIRLAIDQRGWIETLSIDGYAFPLKGPAAYLTSFPERPAQFEAWDIERYSLALGSKEQRKASIESRSSPDGSASIQVSRPVCKRSKAAIRFSAKPGEPFLRIAIDVDWQDPEHLLKLCIPTAFASRAARYGSPFGSSQRGQQAGRLETEAAFECPGSRWAMIGDENEANNLYIATEDRYGFGAFEGLLHLSLVRSPLITDADKNPKIRDIAYPSDYSDLQSHSMELAIGRFGAESPLAENPAAIAETLYSKPLSYQGPGISSPLKAIEGSNTLLPCWAKPLPNGDFVLRMHETMGRSGSATVKLAQGYAATPVDLRGTKAGAPLPSSGKLDYKPYELVSLKIHPSNKTRKR